MTYNFKILDSSLTNAEYCGFTLKSMYLYGKTSDGHLCASSGLTRCDDPSEDTYSLKIYVKNKNTRSFKDCWTPIWVPVNPETIQIKDFSGLGKGKELFLSWAEEHVEEIGILPDSFNVSPEADDLRSWMYDRYLEYLSDDYCDWSCLDNDPTAIQLLAWESLSGSIQLQSVLDYNSYVHSFEYAG